MNKEQLKKEFDKTFPYLFSSCDGREGYDAEVTQDVWNFFLPHLISSDEIKREAVKEFVYYCREKEKSDLVVMAINNKWLMFELENDNTDALKSAVLNEFIERYEQDHDFCYINYKWFEAGGMKREKVAPVIKELLKDGIIDYKKGMFTEDGEVFGSGWGIVDIEKARTYLTQSKERRE